jgi:hypothetical protein
MPDWEDSGKQYCMMRSLVGLSQDERWIASYTTSERLELSAGRAGRLRVSVHLRGVGRIIDGF